MVVCTPPLPYPTPSHPSTVSTTSQGPEPEHVLRKHTQPQSKQPRLSSPLKVNQCQGLGDNFTLGKNKGQECSGGEGLPGAEGCVTGNQGNQGYGDGILLVGACK